MRIQITPPTNPLPSSLHTDFIRGVSNHHGPPQDGGAQSTHSTRPAGQRTLHQVGACDRYCTQVCPHAISADMTIQRGSKPPPLNFSKSPYGCIPLPQTTPAPTTLNPILAYTDRRTAQNVSQRRSVDVHRHHICTPATNPSVGSATILLPDGRGITVHASHKGRSFVTVGDMLDALDTMLLGKPSREFLIPVGAMCGGLARSCSCLSGTTALHSLRNQYERAGLMSNEEGFDIWDLWVG
jgi:hypothetical protein